MAKRRAGWIVQGEWHGKSSATVSCYASSITGAIKLYAIHYLSPSLPYCAISIRCQNTINAAANNKVRTDFWCFCVDDSPDQTRQWAHNANWAATPSRMNIGGCLHRHMTILTFVHRSTVVTWDKCESSKSNKLSAIRIEVRKSAEDTKSTRRRRLSNDRMNYFNLNGLYWKWSFPFHIFSLFIWEWRTFWVQWMVEKATPLIHRQFSNWNESWIEVKNNKEMVSVCQW